jgi:hypothetical protein
MSNLKLLASPWWVNLFVLVPFGVYFWWRGKLDLSRSVLACAAIFGIAFGYTEAASVVYLRGYIGILPSEVFRPLAQNPQMFGDIFPRQLAVIDGVREFAAIIMLASLSVLAAGKRYSRLAIFFWIFAFWDIFYYVGLKVLIDWPQSLTTQDVLFLIPVPWYSQVWWPVFISLLLITAVIAGSKKRGKADE